MTTEAKNIFISLSVHAVKNMLTKDFIYLTVDVEQKETMNVVPPSNGGGKFSNNGKKK